MNKLGKAALAALLSLSCCSQSMAAFVLNGTRFIYEEGKKNVSFEVTNNADKTYGGQVWIDNTNQGDGVYMVPQPPFFKVSPKQKQIIRIMNTDSNLPKDRESLFWLNVQEVPPKPEVKDGEGSVLAIAMNTRVKLIYRPASIKDGRKDAEKQVKLEQRGNETWLKNPTPYYMAIVNVKHDSKDVTLSDKVMKEVAQLKPFSDVSLGKKVSGKISVDAVNDWGGVQNYEIH
ncbi:TPA: fimbrial chaperone [Escherichia coli]|uniref:fimbrial chaperone n=1 Tax=Escherichia coli TaxID=562 RepID=UPI001C1A06E2|nr:fimbrial chaperone [Escherichia coli]ELO4290506.1 fimbrial chaperone [Escherichia coli]MDS1715395.1 fimbrial chaperone [Escherichia coli]HBE5854906.1 fimbrial chaperone [Escherichia coli]HBE5990592.1 fimbrial chaperone [Escherichia coli]HBE5999623.1 fimbrial chaperone [Escherichia coli]